MRREAKTERVDVITKRYRVQAITGESVVIEATPDDLAAQSSAFLNTLGLSYPIGLMPGGITELMEEPA